jgi:HB1, ASXL, restriction endonuclease HTH domain
VRSRGAAHKRWPVSASRNVPPLDSSRSAFDAALDVEAKAHSRPRRCSLFLALRPREMTSLAAQGNQVVVDHAIERLCEPSGMLTAIGRLRWALMRKITLSEGHPNPVSRRGGFVTKQLTFLELAKQILSEANRPLSPSEIWKLAVAKNYVSRLDTVGKTPEQTLYTAILLDARDNPDSKFIKYDTRPARYFLKRLVNDAKSSELGEKTASEPSVPTI